MDSSIAFVFYRGAGITGNNQEYKEKDQQNLTKEPQTGSRSQK
jgi:hypothetical protein